MKIKPYATNKPVIKLTAVNIAINNRLQTVFMPAEYDETGKARVNYSVAAKVVSRYEGRV